MKYCFNLKYTNDLMGKATFLVLVTSQNRKWSYSPYKILKLKINRPLKLVDKCMSKFYHVRSKIS